MSLMKINLQKNPQMRIVNAKGKQLRRLQLRFNHYGSLLCRGIFS